ncbi:MAG TPA: glycosyltransferase family 4 protein [Pyrinomonadaceae bacterium]|nr:glycosyltransferase family 4 protein [Pyrinomonadaceae bacterium]
MKIVWISHSGEPNGGAELSLWEAARGLAGRGVELHAVVPESRGLGERLEAAGARVWVVPFAWWVGRGRWRAPRYRLKRAGRNLFYLPRLRRLLTRLSPDVVMSNTLAVPSGALAARWAGLPHVWYVHELFGVEGHGLYFDWGQSASLSLMDRLSERILVNSETVLRSFSPHVSGEKLRVVRYAVEVPERTLPASVGQKGLKLIQVGLLSPGKRQEDAVRALALLAARGLDVRLKLLGDEARGYESLLPALCRELGVEGRVEFVPFSLDPFSHIAAADVVVMCSRGEAFGRVTVEAMKLGKPVVGADSAGTAELIRDGETGLLFRLGDAEDLARAIGTLYAAPALVVEMGERARAWATASFSSEGYASALIEVFKEVAGAAGRVGRTAGAAELSASRLKSKA